MERSRGHKLAEKNEEKVEATNSEKGKKKKQKRRRAFERESE